MLQTPFREQCSRTAERPPRPLKALLYRSHVPQEVRALMLECLQQQPAARPTSLQVLARLRAVIEGGTSTGSPKAEGIPVGTAGAADAAAASDGAGSSVRAASALPLKAVAMPIQLRPTPPSPFAS